MAAAAAVTFQVSALVVVLGVKVVILMRMGERGDHGRGRGRGRGQVHGGRKEEGELCKEERRR